MNKNILLVEDDNDLREYLQNLLVEYRFQVQSTGYGAKAIKLVESIHPDLILLDLTLPDIDGESLCAQIKKDYPEIHIIIITGKNDPQDIVRNLNLGADDYVTKPFSIDELLARIRAPLRNGSGSDSVLTADGLKMDNQTMQVTRDNKVVELTKTEFQLLQFLLEHKNQVLSRDVILAHVWSATPDIETRVVDVYIGYLRKKIDHGHKLKLINSVRGFGYIIKDNKTTDTKS